MNWIAIIVNPNNNKVRKDRFYLKKIVIGIVRRDQFLYISLNLVINTVLIAIVFHFQISDLFLSRPPFYFIPTFHFHLHPSCAYQIVGVDLCPISTFLKSLSSSCKAENYCSDITSSLMGLESQLQSVQCGGSNFPLNILQPFSLSCSFFILILISGMVRNVTLDGKPHLLTLALFSRGRIPPRTTLLDHHDQISPLHPPTWILMTLFTVLGLLNVLRLGLWPNIHINIYSQAYHPYNYYYYYYR